MNFFKSWNIQFHIGKNYVKILLELFYIDNYLWESKDSLLEHSNGYFLLTMNGKARIIAPISVYI